MTSTRIIAVFPRRRLRKQEDAKRRSIPCQNDASCDGHEGDRSKGRPAGNNPMVIIETSGDDENDKTPSNNKRSKQRGPKAFRFGTAPIVALLPQQMMYVHTWVSFIDRFGGKEKGRHGADDDCSRSKNAMAGNEKMNGLDGESIGERAMRSDGWGCTGYVYVDRSQWDPT
jgi:hypothetical protein